jgi:hypothetical protein
MPRPPETGGTHYGTARALVGDRCMARIPVAGSGYQYTLLEQGQGKSHLNAVGKCLTFFKDTEADLILVLAGHSF